MNIVRSGFVLLALLAPHPFGAIADEPPDCGTRSLYLLLGLAGQGRSLEELRQILPAERADGYTMYELKAAAARRSVRLEGVTLERSSLNLDRPAILLLAPSQKSGHYIVIRPMGTSGDRLQILEPPFHPRVVKNDVFPSNPAWTGHALMPVTFRDRVSARALPIGMTFVAVIILARQAFGAGRRPGGNST